MQATDQESLRILKQSKTPFVVAANKVDRIHGWDIEEGRSMAISMRGQTKNPGLFDQRFWELVGQFAEEGFNLERYEKIKDFTKEIAMYNIC